MSELGLQKGLSPYWIFPSELVTASFIEISWVRGGLLSSNQMA